MTTAGRRVRVLPALVANQIAAGEVVERPASVVKELVENALDAGAGSIGVDLEQGGIELVRVIDDGEGIHAEDLPLALASHATSKIDAAEDLARIGTLGFRGEALASIASVSRVSIRSTRRGSREGAMIECAGGASGPVRPAPPSPGTIVEVRNLFFNTPARRKFLRTVGTEQGRCLDVLREIALAHPGVAFRATCDGRVSMDLPRRESPGPRALDVLGHELAPEMLAVHADTLDDARGVALWGLVGRPGVARGSSKSQHVLVNGRAVRDRTIQHALAEAYRGLIEPSRYPTAVLLLEMSPEGVDVNVHPAKAEVRFRDSSMVHSTVLRAVRDALRAADLTPTFHALGRAPAPSSLPGPGLVGPQTTERVAPDPRPFVEFFQRARPAPGERLSFPALREALAGDGPGATTDARAPAALDTGVVPASSPAVAPPLADGALVETKPSSRVLQVHKSYLVTEDQDGVVIIDQHALHERVMFEYLVARVALGAGEPGATRGLESQRLLAPAVVEATPQQLARLPELQPLLARLGIDAAPLDSRAVGVHAFPTFLFDRGVDPAELVRDLLDRVEADGFAPTSESAMRDVLDMMACKAAVKAGDRLSELELAELVKLRDQVERSSNCPHGRPTSVRLTIHELERLFGRS